jgi:archaellum component FlaG (FlaF/FlaG flagellin family)
MKSLITLAVLAFSFNSFANSTFAPTYDFFYGIYTTSDISTNGFNICKEAQAVVEDANAYYANGEVSATLAAHIKNIQSDSSVSEQEAVDMLVESAQNLLIANQKN